MKDLSAWMDKWRAQYQALDNQHRWMFIGSVVAVLIIAGWMMMPKGPVLGEPEVKEEKLKVVSNKEEDGYFLGDEVDRKAYVGRLEGQYFDL